MNKLIVKKKRVLWTVESLDGTVWGVFADRSDADNFKSRWEETLNDQ